MSYERFRPPTKGEFGRLVRAKRKRDDLSLREAASDARVSFSTISRVENGELPTFITFCRLADWLGLEMEQVHRLIRRFGAVPRKRVARTKSE